MKIAFLASEVFPYAKTGGLADVAGALPRHLSREGLETAVFMPFYREVKRKGRTLVKALDAQKMDWKGVEVRFNVWADPAPQDPVCFIENDDYYDRDGLYGTSSGDYSDNGERFAFFAKAALEALKSLPFEADVIHAHDWQAAPALAYLRHVYAADDFYARMGTLFTVHNMAYQGLFPPGLLEMIGLPPRLNQMAEMEYYGRISFLKGGILYATAVNTVSPRYAREIQTPEYGCGLDGILRARAEALSGILNGAEYSEWDPSKDAFLKAPYSPADRTGKAACKSDLLRIFGLAPAPLHTDIPLVGIVSRLVSQKGLDLLVEALGGLFSLGLKLVVLGTGDPAIEKALLAAKGRFPSFFGLEIGFHPELAHKVYAGSDMFLIPSRFEPCGLTQMYSLKYGTIPVVRATGGLDDSIREFDPGAGIGTGFKFANPSPADLIAAVRRAVRAYARKDLWAGLVRNAMNADFSWGPSARLYAELYGKILAQKKARGPNGPGAGL